MKPIGLWMLLLLTASAPVVAQSNDAPAPDSRVVVEAIECKGNTTLPCDFIRGKLHLPANSEADGDAVQSAQLRLSALPNFESVRVYLQKGSEKGKALLIVEVIEASPLVTELALSIQYLSFEQSDATSDTSFDMPDRLSESFTGRIGHLNLFGRQKIGELAVKAYRLSYSQVDFSNLDASLVYVDPNLFGVDRLFMSVSGAYGYSKGDVDQQYAHYDPIIDSTILSDVHSEHSDRSAHMGLSVGYRLWDYSYVFADFKRFTSSYRQSYEGPPPFENQVDVGTHRADFWRLGYGWDSEDDAYFPTHGSRLSVIFTYTPACFVCNEIDWRVAYRHAWMMGRSTVWTVNVGGEPEAANDRLRTSENTTDSGLGLTYAYLLPASDVFGGIRRGRWYVQLGADPFDLSRDRISHLGDPLSAVSITLGLRFESKVLGVVNLFAAGRRYFQ